MKAGHGRVLSEMPAGMTLVFPLCHFLSLLSLSYSLSLPQGVIGPGGVQWMTAGRGLVHSEMPVGVDGRLWGFQLWINLPAQHKMIKPR